MAVYQCELKAFGKVATVIQYAKTEHQAAYQAKGKVKIHAVDENESGGGFDVKFQIGELRLKKHEPDARTPATAIDRVLAAIEVSARLIPQEQTKKDPVVEQLCRMFGW